MQKLTEKYRGFIIDLDGTLILENTLIKGAKTTVNKLLEYGKDVIVVSNKTTEPKDSYFKLLNENGMNISRGKIIVSSDVLKNYLFSNFRNKYFFAIAEKSFIASLNNGKLKYSEDPSKIDIVIITLDRNFNSNKFNIALESLNKGARFFAANIDDSCPVEKGEITDAGKIISRLELNSKRRLEKHFGKPSALMFEAIKSVMQFNPREYLIVGDRLQTDIKMGNLFGVHTALVSTGVKKNFEFNKEIKPTYRIDSIASLITYIL